MTFDLYTLDQFEDWDEEAEEALEKYQHDILQLFVDSPEGQELLEFNPEFGFWIDRFIDYGYVYEGFTLPHIDKSDVQTILLELFPRKISLTSPDETKETIPELIAFWKYLKREYDLDNADQVLKCLESIESEFQKAMNDPSNFGMAKSFFMAGQNAGFDMTNEQEMNEFAYLYNTEILKQENFDSSISLSDMFSLLPSDEDEISRKPKISKSKKKAKAKMVKASRKKNRKKH